MKHKENITMQKAKGLISVVSTGSLCIVFADVYRDYTDFRKKTRLHRLLLALFIGVIVLQIGVIIFGFSTTFGIIISGFSITFGIFLADRTFFIKNI